MPAFTVKHVSDNGCGFIHFLPGIDFRCAPEYLPVRQLKAPKDSVLLKRAEDMVTVRAPAFRADCHELMEKFPVMLWFKSGFL